MGAARAEGASGTGDSTGYVPIIARTQTAHRPVGPVAYDCVKVVVVRDGSAVLFSEFGQKPIGIGDVLLLTANTLYGSEPEGHITTSTVYLDTDYVLDQVRWQYVGIVQDRLEAQCFAETTYTEPAQVLNLGEERAGMLMPWLDELVTLSINGEFTAHFFRMQALWFSIAHVIAPFIKVSAVRMSPSQRAHTRPSLPRDRRFAPLRDEARQVADLLRQAPEQRWNMDALAREVHLSVSQLSRVFTDAYGKTPLAFQMMIRAERMAQYLRETDVLVTEAMRRVGWRSRSHATSLFRQYVGVTPGKYRKMHRRSS